jgi:hypothetical protein
MLSIQLNGFETPGMLRAVMSALRTYVDEATEEYIQTRGADKSVAAFEAVMNGDTFQGASNVPPPAVEVPAASAAEVVAAEKPATTRRKRAPAAEEVKATAAEQPPVDNAHVAAGCEQFAEDGKPAPEVKIEEIRAVAKLFNTDELREIALEILRKHDAASVTALAERENIIRVSALADFQAAATQHNLA